MTQRLELHPDARAEAEAAIDWYAVYSHAAARACVEELYHAIDSILEAPEH